MKTYTSVSGKAMVYRAWEYQQFNINFVFAVDGSEKRS